MVLNSYLELSRHSPGEESEELIERELKVIKRIHQQILFTREYQDIGVKAPSWQDVRKTVGNAAAILDHSGIRLDLDLPDLEIYADPLLQKAFYNILDNTLRYGEKATRVTVSCRRVEGGTVLTIKDDGVGIESSEKPSIFDKGVGKNTGYGLFLTREILQITGLSITETGIPVPVQGSKSSSRKVPSGSAGNDQPKSRTGISG